MPKTEAELQEAIDWIRSRPACLHDLMIKFPPSCRVRALRPLHVPRPGTEGQLLSYVEDQKNGKHSVTVFELPDGKIRAQCQPEWLEVVGYYENVTPEFVKMALGRS